MTVFWLSIFALGTLAVGFLLWPLTRFAQRKSSGKRESYTIDNLRVFNDRLAELNAEKNQGFLGLDEYQQLKMELEKNLLLDVPEAEPVEADAMPIGKPHWMIALIIGVGVFSTSLVLYLFLGRSADLPAHLAVQKPTPQAVEHEDNFSAAIASLEQKIAVNPGDVENGLLLARSYGFTQQYRRAAETFAGIVKLLQPADSRYPRVLSAYAEALYMANNETLNADIDALVQRVLQLDPQDYTALTLQGLGAYRQGKYQQAIAAWELAFATAPNEQKEAFLQPALADARQKLTNNEKPAAQPGTSAGVKLRVALDADYAKLVSPEDVVFIMARQRGEVMPVAIQRLLVKELPADLQLDDSSSLMPSKKISTFSDVEVLARVSRSGQAKAMPGDLTAAALPAKVGSHETVELLINSVVQ